MRTVLAFLLLALSALPLHARDNGQYAQVSPDLKRWIEGLTDGQGRGCCATADGLRLEEYDWDTLENSYRVLINGVWYLVPDVAVVKEPNRLGFTMVWYYVDNGVLYIRCFLRGAGG